jgi:putative membrane protein
MMGFGMGMMGGGTFIWIILIVAVIYFVSNKNSNQKSSYKHNYHSQKGNNDAIEIAKERYAKGEIDKEEYEEILDDLN